MSKIYEASASSSMTLHGADRMAAEANPENAGALTITAWNGTDEVFDLTIFTRDDLLSVELAVAINAVLLRRGRLNSEHVRAAA